MGTSAPVFNIIGEPIAVLNIWAVHPRHSVDDLIGWAPELLASKRAVTQLIGSTVCASPAYGLY